ncbi:MAG: CPBP family intramembrane glutamic endopeptidase [Thermoplasmata archaeon]
MSTLEKAMKFAFFLFVIAFYMMLITANYLGLFFALYIVPRNILLSNPSMHFGLFVPTYIHLFTISGTSVLLYFYFIVIFLIASFVLLVYFNLKSCIKEIRERKRIVIASHNPLLIMGEVFSVIVFITIFYNLFLNVVNVSPAAPEFESAPLWENMLSLANAAIYEEFAVRVLFLAIPLFVIQYIRDRKFMWKAFFIGGQKLDALSAILILFSSVIFGVAHALYGWDIYKIFPAFVAGAGFGYLYIKGGFFASVLMHFAFDYLDITYMLATKNVLSPAFEFLAMPGIFISTIVLMFAIAVAPIVLYGYWKKFMEKYRGMPRSSTAYQKAGRVEGGLISLQFPVGKCPKCGCEESRYLGWNMLECVRCGEKRKMG